MTSCSSQLHPLPRCVYIYLSLETKGPGVVGGLQQHDQTEQEAHVSGGERAFPQMRTQDGGDSCSSALLTQSLSYKQAGAEFLQRRVGGEALRAHVVRTQVCLFVQGFNKCC